MPHRPEADWSDLTPAEAVALQERMRALVAAEGRLGPVRRVAGLDVGYARGAHRAAAAGVMLSFPELKLIEAATVGGGMEAAVPPHPYIPGLLVLREGALMLSALERLRGRPDLLLVDGHGLAHPRRFGLACYLGVASGIPTIGVAKSRLIGEYEQPGPARGDWSRLMDGGEVIGAVLRVQAGVRPVFVSVGNRVSLEAAIEYTLACSPRHRLAEPIRWAHRLAGETIRLSPLPTKR